MHRLKIRLMGTHADVEAFMILFNKMNDRQIISIIEESDGYTNRGTSRQLRKYLEVDLLLDVHNPNS